MPEFKRFQRVHHFQYGEGVLIEYAPGRNDRAKVKFDLLGELTVWVRNLSAIEDTTPKWSDVMPGDTVEFEVNGDTIKVKAQGSGTQATVLGWRTTELDGVWDLLSIKKRNPPVPTRFGAKVMYRDKIWILMHSSMVLGTGPKGITAEMIWVEINKTRFNWVGHMDIDREQFEVIFTGWQDL